MMTISIKALALIIIVGIIGISIVTSYYLSLKKEEKNYEVEMKKDEKFKVFYNKNLLYFLFDNYKKVRIKVYDLEKEELKIDKEFNLIGKVINVHFDGKNFYFIVSIENNHKREIFIHVINPIEGENKKYALNLDVEEMKYFLYNKKIFVNEFDEITVLVIDTKTGKVISKIIKFKKTEGEIINVNNE